MDADSDGRISLKELENVFWHKEFWKDFLGGGNSNIFYVHPYLGKISNWTNIFQMGWNFETTNQFWIPFWIPMF